MNSYEAKSIFLTKVSLVLALVGTTAALVFGYEQILINQELVNTNYEPGLTIQLSKPVSNYVSWLNLVNNGKSAVTFYGTKIEMLTATSTDDATEQVIDTS